MSEMRTIEKDNGITQINDACFEPSKFKIREPTIYPQNLAFFWTNPKIRELGFWLKMYYASSDHLHLDSWGLEMVLVERYVL